MFVHRRETDAGLCSVYNLFPSTRGRAMNTSQEVFQLFAGKFSSKRKTIWMARLMRVWPGDPGAPDAGNKYFTKTLHKISY